MTHPWGGTTLAASSAEISGFLNTGELAQTVREPIGDSWRRSVQLGVDPSDLHSATSADEPAVDIPAAVDRVLAGFTDQFADEPVSVIFANTDGRVLRRDCGDPGLRQHLERVYLAPGSGYGEGHVGTNGIGTALESAKPTLVVGGEHYAEPLRVFACAGVPVRHPVSCSVIGVVDITCKASHNNALLMATAQTIARSIEDELFRDVGQRELALLRDYMMACRHATGPVMALNGDLVMMNRHAQNRLTPPDRVALLARTADAVDVREPRTLITDLPSGAVARMDYRPTCVANDVVGGVFRIRVDEPAALAAPVDPPVRWLLPGLIGSSPEWVRACASVRTAARTHEWLVIDGEDGVGKLALARAAHRDLDPGARLTVLDCRDLLENRSAAGSGAAKAPSDPDRWLDAVEAELDGDAGTLVLRRIEALPSDVLGPLSELLVEHADSSAAEAGVWVVATRGTGPGNADAGLGQPAGASPAAGAAAGRSAVDAILVPCFARTVAVPPLRHRPDDISVLAPRILQRLSRSDGVRLSPAALSRLARLPWLGNTAQLQDVLAKAVQNKRVGTIDVADLPPECQSATRRALTPLEALERDAIVHALRDHRGNKSEAATHLGMSRATIYRKIRDYAIDPAARR